MKLAWAAVAAVFLTVGLGTAEDPVPADEILGQWYTDGNESIVVVTQTDGKYFGKIIWLSEPLYTKDEPDGDAGKPKRNKNASEPADQKKPIIGLQVLKNFAYDADDKSWSGGTIYDPNNGRTYKCVVRMQEDAKGIDGKSLHVRGYIGIPQLGRTTVWYRVPEDKMQKVETK